MYRKNRSKKEVKREAKEVKKRTYLHQEIKKRRKNPPHSTLKASSAVNPP